jgi:hypothetical protein
MVSTTPTVRSTASPDHKAPGQPTIGITSPSLVSEGYPGRMADAG